MQRPHQSFQMVSRHTKVQDKMIAKLTLLLAVAATVLSAHHQFEISDNVAQKLIQTVCYLAYGAEDTVKEVDVLNTKCKPNCYFERKLIVFQCRNYPGIVELLCCLPLTFQCGNVFFFSIFQMQTFVQWLKTNSVE